MASTVAADRQPRHRVIAEIEPAMLRADLRKAESGDLLAEVGGCLDYARREAGWTLDELAGHMPPAPGADKRDSRQVQRWIDGKERTQVDVVFAVPELRGPFVIALARMANEFEEETTLRRKRRTA